MLMLEPKTSFVEQNSANGNRGISFLSHSKGSLQRYQGIYSAIRDLLQWGDWLGQEFAETAHVKRQPLAIDAGR